MSTTQIVDLCYLSDTMPDLPKYAIPRDNYLEAIEHSLKDREVFFLTADEGTGVTTTLALFANYHHYNCVSYFNNGLTKQLLDPDFIEQSLVRQLYFFLDRTTILTDEDAARLDLKGLYLQLRRKMRKADDTLYFVFDGFSDIPPQSKENIRVFMESLPWDMGKFIFSGRYEELKDYLPKKIKCAPDKTLQKFSKCEVISLLQEIQPDLDKNEYDALCRISGCMGSQLRAMFALYNKYDSFRPILELNDSDASDLYAYSFKSIEEAKNSEVSIKVLALVAFISVRLSMDDICRVLSMDILTLTEALKTCEDYLMYRDNFIVFNSECNHRYIQKRLDKLRRQVELLFIQQFKNDCGNPIVCSYMPSLLKAVNDKRGLVDYLNAEVMLKSLEYRQSQSVLNEQCELGFSSSDFNDKSQTANTFRLALHKSSSREIEQNELWDYQIDALMAVGYYEKAYSSALSVYLQEERLKALLLIARWEKEIPSSLLDGVRANIKGLVSEIQFEQIPDKSMELVKLMFPYDYKIAVDIIERIAKVSKNRIPIDKLYSILSISSGQERDLDNNAKFDVLASKIENDDIKRMTRAVRNIFSKTDIDGILTELKELPSIQQGLYLLQYWIPTHTKIEGIGKLVVYAVQSVMSISNIERPRVTLISDFCTALPNMSSSEVDQIIVMLDSFQASLLAPSEEFVRLELKVVEALFKFNEDRACERLQNLYVIVDDFENKSTTVACKSIILEKYSSLGHSELLASTVMSAVDLQKEIEHEISDLFEKTAYHLKIVEQPLRSLVVDYKTSIEEIISKMNTQERRSRAYMIAADSYINLVKPRDWDWDYLTGLIGKIDYDTYDRSSAVAHMASEVVNAKDIDADVLEYIKKHHELFLEVEQASLKCSVLSDLYILFKKVLPSDSFADYIYKELSSCWESIDLYWLKLNNGYMIAKTLAKVSIDEAKEWIKKVSSIEDSSVMASSSSVAAFRESVDLYNRTMGVLIRAKLDEDKVLKEFEEVTTEFESEGEQIISWSKIALYYYLEQNIPKFDEIYAKHISKNLDNYSDYYRKFIIYNSAPTLFLASKGSFYNQLDRLDGLFRDACISRVAKFIFVKYTEVDDSGPFRGAYDLSWSDFENLIDLLWHCNDDSTFFGIFDTVCQSLKKSRTKVSLDQKKLYVNQLSSLIDCRLPMNGFIQHDGYIIACRISLSQLDGQIQNKVILDEWEKSIDRIDNSADQAFLYIHAANYATKSEKRQQFINKATSIISTIPSTFDKSCRIDLCLDVCSKKTTGLTTGVVNQFMEIICADRNGRISDIKKAYDCIYDYNPELADSFLERMDTDPARNYYKDQLRKHSEQTKNIASAKGSLSKITSFSMREQQLFFSEQLSNQISQKGSVYDIQSTLDIMHLVYKYAISDVHDALNYFIENAFRKHKLSGNLSNLLQGMHEATLVNLKMVLALSSGTKDKLFRISKAISESYVTNCPSLVLAGEEDKAIDYIINWYKSYPYDNLFIIDAYFSPRDLFLVKRLMNINSGLSLTIITHKKNVERIEEYQKGWEEVSSDLTGSITIHTISYEQKPDQGPLHARWWLSIDEDQDLRVGIKLSSISGLGKKDEDFSAIEDDKIADIERLATNYALGKRKKVEDNVLKYESIILR